jgi:acyl-CoA dehydrogenase
MPAALQVERPPSLAEEDIVIFEDAVARFFTDHAPESRGG